MKVRNRLWIVGVIGLLSSCSSSKETRLSVAAAANLTGVLGQIGSEFTRRTAIEVVFSYGSTAQLAQQIENGAPFDLFASADVEHIDALVKTGKLDGASRAVYAFGQLALWIPMGDKLPVRALNDLKIPQIRFVAIAQPNLAPYGKAAREALEATRLWSDVEPKVVYTNSVNQAKQLAASGNADAAFTACSLVLHEQGTVLKIDPSLHAPIQQALAVIRGSTRSGDAQKFRDFILGPEGRRILTQSGYILP